MALVAIPHFRRNTGTDLGAQDKRAKSSGEKAAWQQAANKTSQIKVMPCVSPLHSAMKPCDYDVAHISRTVCAPCVLLHVRKAYPLANLKNRRHALGVKGNLL